MRTYKTLGGGLAAILLLILTQLIAQGAAGLLAMIKLPAGVCNIIAGILYAGLGYAALRLLSEKVLHEHTAALGMPKLHIQPRWAITAVLLPLAVTGCYLLLFRGTFVRADMRGDEMFSTLSAGIAFTGIAAGFVEEMVFRGVILNLFAQRWNKVVAVIVPSLLFGIVHADQILVLDGGRIAGCGTHSDLLRGCETYREIALSQLSAAELGQEG